MAVSGLLALNVATLLFVVTREPEPASTVDDGREQRAALERRIEELSSTVTELQRDNATLRTAVSDLEKKDHETRMSSASSTSSPKQIPETLEEKLQRVPGPEEILPNSEPRRVEISVPPGGGGS